MCTWIINSNTHYVLASDPRADTFRSNMQNYDARDAPAGRTDIQRYGTAGLGLDLTAEAWPSLDQTFNPGSSDPRVDAPNRPACEHVSEVLCLSKTFLRHHPVDLLVLGDLDATRHDVWLDQIIRSQNQPQQVFEFWTEDCLLREEGPVSKVRVTHWTEAGYRTTCRLLNATQVGGVVDLPWLLVVRYKSNDFDKDRTWPHAGEGVCRPMNNCLRPTGIPGAAYRRNLDSDGVKLLFP
jgi:hypothetical protein